MLADLIESRPPFPSHQWFATAQRLREEDDKRLMMSRKKQRRYLEDEQK